MYFGTNICAYKTESQIKNNLKIAFLKFIIKKFVINGRYQRLKAGHKFVNFMGHNISQKRIRGKGGRFHRRNICRSNKVQKAATYFVIGETQSIIIYKRIVVFDS